MSKTENYLEIETKYDASEIDRVKFKVLLKDMPHKSFTYVESTDIYYVKNGDDFLRYRLPAENLKTSRSELTFKKKILDRNNIVRTEVNLRIDNNSDELVKTFCNGLGYQENFSIYKMCDIYFFEDANIVYYSVSDNSNKISNFIEIEAAENIGLTQEQAWEVVQKYEKALTPLGITSKNRLRKSLFEMYRK